MDDQNLSVGIRTCADSNRRNVERLGELGAHHSRYSLDDEAVNTFALENKSVFQEQFGGVARLGLDLVAAEGEHALGGQTEVSHHGDLGIE